MLPGPGTSYAPELAMSRPDVAPASLSPALEALDAAQPSQSFQTLEQPAVEPPASIRLEQVRPTQHTECHLLHCIVWQSFTEEGGLDSAFVRAACCHLGSSAFQQQ